MVRPSPMNLSQSLLCAALLAATLAPSHAQARPGGRPAAGGTQSADDKAIALFTEGQKLYEQGNYSAALEKFRQVDELMKSPNARLYMARCQRELGRLPEAFELMSDAVEASNDKAKTDESYLRTRDAAAAEREAIVAKIGRLVVAAADAPAGLVVKVNDRELKATELGHEIGVKAGSATVTAEAPGHQPFSHSLKVPAGSQQTVAVVLRAEGEPLPATPGAAPSTAVRDAGFAILAVGVIGMGLFAVEGALADSRYSKIERECGDPPCRDPSYTDLIQGGKTMDLVADIGLGVGLAGLVTGTLMVILGWPSDKAAAAEGKDPSAEPDTTPGNAPAAEQSGWVDIGPNGATLCYRLKF